MVMVFVPVTIMLTAYSCMLSYSNLTLQICFVVHSSMHLFGPERSGKLLCNLLICQYSYLSAVTFELEAPACLLVSCAGCPACIARLYWVGCLAIHSLYCFWVSTMMRPLME